MTVTTRVDLAILGIRGRAPVSRPAGAGPSADGHLVLDGASVAVPLNDASPYWLDGDTLMRDGVVVEDVTVEPVRRPRFYDLATADGVAYEQLARLHGRDVLATTVVQTCIRYDAAERCRFCAIEASLEAGSTTAVKRPYELAEVAEAAVRLDGVRQMVMTTGTSAGRDRGRDPPGALRPGGQGPRCPTCRSRCSASRPGDLATITELREAGADAIGIHVESLDDDVRRRWMPGKSRVPLAEYRAAWAEAVRVFGRNQVSTYLLVGLGEDPDELVAGARELIAMGVYPFVVPFRPLAGTLAAARRGDRPRRRRCSTTSRAGSPATWSPPA